jgi:hypothetical protein
MHLDDASAEVSGGMQRFFTGRAGYQPQFFRGHVFFKPELRLGVRL